MGNADFTFPGDQGSTLTFNNARSRPAFGEWEQQVPWLLIPVRTTDSIANCYIHGTGVATFNVDPEWEFLPLQFGTLKMTFPTGSPLASGDVFLDGCATVGFGVYYRTRDTPWTLALDEIVYPLTATGTQLELMVHAAYLGDVWVYELTYQLDLLIYRPNFEPQQFIPWDSPAWQSAVLRKRRGR